jgi:hypothetical protein
MKQLFSFLSLVLFVSLSSQAQCDLTGVFQAYQWNNSGSVYFYAEDSAELCLPELVEMTYVWDFGDGNISDGQTNQHYYPAAGIYNVCLTVTMYDGSTGDYINEVTTCQAITVINCNTMGGVVTASAVGDQVLLSFANWGMFPIAQYMWQVGGAIQNSNTAELIINNPGAAFVTGYLVVTDINGCVYTIAIDVLNPLWNPCETEFSYSASGPNYYFYNQYINGSTTAVWYVDGLEVGTGGYLSYNFDAPGTYTVTCVVENTEAGCTSETSQEITITAPVVLCGYAFLDANENGIMDDGEMGIENMSIYSGNGADSVWTDANGYYEIDVYTDQWSWLNANFWNSGYSVIPGGLVNVDGYIQIDPANLSTDCIYNFPMEVYQGTICGTAYLDFNQNNWFDSGEQTMANVNISYAIWNGVEYEYLTTLTDDNGQYCLTIPAGYQYLTATYTTLGGSSLSEYLSVFVTDDQTSGGADFAFYFIENAIDVAVTVGAWGNPVPGFTNGYTVSLTNYGDTDAMVNVTMYWPLFMEPSNIWPLNGATGVYNPATNSVTWANVPVAAMEWTYGYVYSYTAIGTALGTSVAVSANVSVINGDDVNPANNNSAINQVVVGSYDPNNKLNFPSGVGEAGEMLPTNDPFTYVVNFQNTGTSEAVNIRVEDQLDTDLDWSTLEMISASHAYTMQIENGAVVWYFNNIMLPDSNTNEELSHGQIIYRIHPIADKPVGTVFENTAYIYFDFNEAIITNTTINTFVTSIGVREVQNVSGISIYPNPSEGDFTISAEDMNAGDYLVIFDAMGREVFRKQIMNSNTTRIDTNLPTGQYVLQIQGAAKVRTTKVVVR